MQILLFNFIIRVVMFNNNIIIKLSIIDIIYNTYYNLPYAYLFHIVNITICNANLIINNNKLKQH